MDGQRSPQLFSYLRYYRVQGEKRRKILNRNKFITQDIEIPTACVYMMHTTTVRLFLSNAATEVLITQGWSHLGRVHTARLPSEGGVC